MNNAHLKKKKKRKQGSGPSLGLQQPGVGKLHAHTMGVRNKIRIQYCIMCSFSLTYILSGPFFYNNNKPSQHPHLTHAGVRKWPTRARKHKKTLQQQTYVYFFFFFFSLSLRDSGRSPKTLCGEWSEAAGRR